jgi:CheY-like chemotaxis protein
MIETTTSTKAETHILVVEDAQLDYELIQHELESTGLRFSAKRIDTHEELSRELDVQPPTLVLCDHGNAQLDSFSVLELVRARSKTLPFIVVTGALDDDQLSYVYKRGADDCVLKHRLPDLGPAVQRALRLGEARRRLALAEAECERLRAELEAWRYGKPRTATAIPICAGCKKIREPHGSWLQLESYFRDHFNIRFSHGLCPHCVKEYSVGHV